jgi:hypothetical protein
MILVPHIKKWQTYSVNELRGLPPSQVVFRAKSADPQPSSFHNNVQISLVHVTFTARLTTLVEEWPQSFKGDQKELVTIDFTPFLQAEVGRYHTVPYLHTQYNVIIFYQYSDNDTFKCFSSSEHCQVEA